MQKLVKENTRLRNKLRKLMEERTPTSSKQFKFWIMYTVIIRNFLINVQSFYCFLCISFSEFYLGLRVFIVRFFSLQVFTYRHDCLLISCYIYRNDWNHIQRISSLSEWKTQSTRTTVSEGYRIKVRECSKVCGIKCCKYCFSEGKFS
jgi:hypothetical protein